MRVSDFIKENDCEEEFKAMAKVWNHCAEEELNLSVDC